MEEQNKEVCVFQFPERILPGQAEQSGKQANGKSDLHFHDFPSRYFGAVSLTH